MLEKGREAIGFDLEGSDGKRHSLEEFSGRYLVLYFYPKDMTPGCTKEALLFEKLRKEFEGRNASIVGVSKDSVESHKKFQEKEKLNFLLLSDPDALLAKAYGAYGKRKFYGVPYEGTIRSTFVIGPDGKLVSAEYDVRPQESPEDALRCVCEG